MIYTSADQLIGNTPLLEMVHLEEKYELKAKNCGEIGIFKSRRQRERQGGPGNDCICRTKGTFKTRGNDY